MKRKKKPLLKEKKPCYPDMALIARRKAFFAKMGKLGAAGAAGLLLYGCDSVDNLNAKPDPDDKIVDTGYLAGGDVPPDTDVDTGYMVGIPPIDSDDIPYEDTGYIDGDINLDTDPIDTGYLAGIDIPVDTDPIDTGYLAGDISIDTDSATAPQDTDGIDTGYIAGGISMDTDSATAPEDTETEEEDTGFVAGAPLE